MIKNWKTKNNIFPINNGVLRTTPAFSLFAILGAAALRLRLRNRCGLGLNRNPPFLDEH
jgi:hypothetical protein